MCFESSDEVGIVDGACEADLDLADGEDHEGDRDPAAVRRLCDACTDRVCQCGEEHH